MNKAHFDLNFAAHGSLFFYDYSILFHLFKLINFFITSDSPFSVCLCLTALD